TSIRSFDDPCGSWQLTQLSRPAACSKRNGPRFSVWQETQLSLIQLPSRSCFTLVAPCGLWQLVHVILPSATGMCDTRLTFCTCTRWHVPHSSCSVAFLS